MFTTDICKNMFTKKYPKDIENKIICYYYSLVFNDVVSVLKNKKTIYRDRYFVYTTDDKCQITFFDYEYNLKKPSDPGNLIIINEYNIRLILKTINYCKICNPTWGFCERCIPCYFSYKLSKK